MIFTEKFALLNILKALEGISAKNSDNKTEESTQQNPIYSAAAEQESIPQAAAKSYPNVMASVLERHEAISNRVRNKK